MHTHVKQNYFHDDSFSEHFVVNCFFSKHLYLIIILKYLIPIIIILMDILAFSFNYL